jgi:hypothetical protein
MGNDVKISCKDNTQITESQQPEERLPANGDKNNHSRFRTDRLNKKATCSFG